MSGFRLRGRALFETELRLIHRIDAETYVMQHRAEGDSWRRLALRFKEDFDRDVWHGTLYKWYHDLESTISTQDVA